MLIQEKYVDRFLLLIRKLNKKGRMRNWLLVKASIKILLIQEWMQRSGQSINKVLTLIYDTSMEGFLSLFEKLLQSSSEFHSPQL